MKTHPFVTAPLPWSMGSSAFLLLAFALALVALVPEAHAALQAVPLRAAEIVAEGVRKRAPQQTCNLPSPIPTGYSVVTDQFGMTVTCATGYLTFGLAWPCDPITNTYTFTGCIPDRNCTLPTALPKGVTRMSPTGCEGYVNVLNCHGIYCDGTNYRGNPPTFTCSANRGTFTITGCDVNICELQPMVPPDPRFIITPGCVGTYETCASSVSCSYGYSKPILSCYSNGTQFTISGCTPNMCRLPTFSSTSYPQYRTDGMCLGYQTNDTCPGVFCADNYGMPGQMAGLLCPTNGSTFVPTGCSENFCQIDPVLLGSAYRLPQGNCSGFFKASTGCNKLTCAPGFTGPPVLKCLANETMFMVSGCRPNNCTTPAPSSTTTTAFEILVNCTTPMTVDQCMLLGSVHCATSTGYDGMAGLECPTNNGTFKFVGCSDNLCKLPAPMLPGYVLPATGKCNGTMKNNSCTGLACQKGWSGKPITFCRNNNSMFELSGCFENVCARPDPPPKGYSFLSNMDCGGIPGSPGPMGPLVTAMQCNGLSCASGYHFDFPPMAICPSNGTNFTFTGCSVNMCKMPVQMPQGYLTTGKCGGIHTVKGSASSPLFDCVDATCAAGWTGTPVFHCDADGGDFWFDGCLRNNCTIPTTIPFGFTFNANPAPPPPPSPSCSDPMTVDQLWSCGYVSCAPGFHSATPSPSSITVECPVQNSTFVFSGCTVNYCTMPLPLAVPGGILTAGKCLGYRTTKTNDTKTDCTDAKCGPGMSGTPTFTCLIHGGSFTLDGCFPNNCTLPDKLPPAYAYDPYTPASPSCPPPGTPLTAQQLVQCGNLHCAGGYNSLHIEAICAANSSNFTFSGCLPNGCTVPDTLPPGYVTTGKCVGLKTPKGLGSSSTDCGDISCAPGWTGTPILGCGADGGDFSITGCSVSNCTLNATGLPVGYQFIPLVTPPPPGALPCDSPMPWDLFLLYCGHVECAPGFSTPNWSPIDISCPVGNSSFALSGCNANLCTMPDYAPAGYITGGKCPGLRTAKSPSSSVAAKTDCTDVKCAAGFSGTPVLTCASNAYDFNFDGCIPNNCTIPPTMPMGYVLDPTPVTPAPTSPPLSSCQDLMTVDQLGYCGTLKCADGYHISRLEPLCVSNGTNFTFTGCIVNMCVMPDTLPPGYTTTGKCTGLKTPKGKGTTATDCGDVTCMPGWTGTPVLKCQFDGWFFTVDGCTPNNCTMNASTMPVGFQFNPAPPGPAQCDQPMPLQDFLMNCGTVSCIPGFSTPNQSPGSLDISCPTNNGVFAVSGCNANLCTMPPFAPFGYLVSGKCSGLRTAKLAGSTTPAKTDCTDVKCASGFGGNATLRCPGHGGDFAFDGCYPSNCTIGTIPTGYIFDTSHPSNYPWAPVVLPPADCNGLMTADQVWRCGDLHCADGYHTNRIEPVCATPGSNFTFSGCSVNMCTMPVVMPAGYVTTGKCMGMKTQKGKGTAATDCSDIACAPGYAGTPTLICLGDGFPFIADGCFPNNCSLPNATSLPVGFAFTPMVPGPPLPCDSGLISLDQVGMCGMVSCASGFSRLTFNGNSAPIDISCPNNGSVFAFSGCLPNYCKLPYMLPMGYTTTGKCVGFRTIKYPGSKNDCSDIKCMAGFGGTPVLSCNNNGMDFEFSGCNPNNCTVPPGPSPAVGYSFDLSHPSTSIPSTPYMVTPPANCAVGTNVTADQLWFCGDLKCADGYHAGRIRPFCPTAGGNFTYFGCIVNTCHLGTLGLGYQSSGDCIGQQPVSGCKGITCVPSAILNGSISISCPINGMEFVVSGCIVP